jgi:hypothetical protein
MIFALIFLTGMISTLIAGPADASMALKLVTTISGMLLAACLITHLSRGKA